MVAMSEQISRELKGKTIAGSKDNTRRIKENLYKVKSQSNNGKEYVHVLILRIEMKNVSISLQ